MQYSPIPSVRLTNIVELLLAESEALPRHVVISSVTRWMTKGLTSAAIMVSAKLYKKNTNSNSPNIVDWYLRVLDWRSWNRVKKSMDWRCMKLDRKCLAPCSKTMTFCQWSLGQDSPCKQLRLELPQKLRVHNCNRDKKRLNNYRSSNIADKFLMLIKSAICIF